MKRLGQLFSLALVLSLALVPAGAQAAKQKTGPGLGLGKVEALIEMRHPKGLDRFVRRVTDPSSPRYRKYASVEKLVNRYGAKPQTKQRVARWLAARGLEGTFSATGTDVLVRMSKRRAAELLPAAEGASVSATGIGRAVPVGLRGAVERVSVISAKPTVTKYAEPIESAGASASSGPYRSMLPHTGTAAGCPDASTGGLGPGSEPITPNQYLTAYGHAGLHARGIKGRGQKVAVVENGGFKRADIERFASCFGVKAPPTTVVPVLVGEPMEPELETTLDLSLLSVGAPELERIYVYEGPGSIAGVAITAGAALGTRGSHPDVISISLGFCEPEVVEQVAFRDALDRVFATAAGAGISVLVSAGDQGSSGCRIEEDGVISALPLPAVSLPSTSRYVTAVGGTNVEFTAKNRIRREIVWNNSVATPWGGGGGTSLLAAHTPWWQKNTEKRFGPGRKVPDVAALADLYPGYAIYCTAASSCEPGEAAVYGWLAVGGTSAAAPLTAAGVALVNQYLEKRGQRRVGFLNPLLYDLGSGKASRRGAFTDVRVGDNNIGRALPLHQLRAPISCCAARRGYDRASGWGSLKMVGFAKLAAGAGR